MKKQLVIFIIGFFSLGLYEGICQEKIDKGVSKKHTISGYVKEQGSQESLPFVSIYIYSIVK